MADLQRSQSSIRFVMLGGFLGAGKTTALLRMAREFTEAGKRVGIITNDQAEGLVDTETFRTAGFDTQEIPSGCFCCKFDELVAAAGRLADGHQPDVLLAEPVGSCTDLVSTVIQPLRALYSDRFSVAPYVALLDPERAWTALSGSGTGGFSAKVTYIYKMQQNEADVVAINKIDTLSRERLEAVTALVKRNFPKAEIIALSARTGEGFGRLTELLDAAGLSGANPVEVDYDTYAEGEARLGWVNATFELTAPQEFDGNRMLLELAEGLRYALLGIDAEPAHVKMILRSGDDLAIANVVGSDRPAELSRAAGAKMGKAKLIINGRVEVDPIVLREKVEQAVERVAKKYRLCPTNLATQALTPSRPIPTHRYAGVSREAAPRPENAVHQEGRDPGRPFGRKKDVS